MQVTFYSEDHPSGQTADWPVIPRKGDIVEVAVPNGPNVLRVDSVRFHMNADGGFHSVDVELIY